ncbi:response regulator [Telluribacter sp. SYSU D00476]|uniref:response regulator n=1 Tax=Telluribacter sp. SYSU D00476 TaxID=2811430 RepID=UPI001FF6E1B2|nr:response regulator [Telluribacter sp. SYSU D00476]
MINNLVLIDDDPITLRIIELTIKRNQFADNVIKLKNGEEGIHFFEKLSTIETNIVPELVFLDLNMPVMNGWDFLDEYAARYQVLFPNTQICILSSSVDPQDQLRAQKYSSVIRFISKPIFISELTELKHHVSLYDYFI